MRIVLHAPRDNAGEWHAAVASALPDAHVERLPEASGSADYALVWKPPAVLFERVRVAKAIFNLGAGADALLDVPTLPNDVPVIRLEDAGMAVQMAEYVTYAALRAYREMDAYAAQQRERRWQPRQRLSKADFAVGLLGFGVLGRAVAQALAPFGFPLRTWTLRSRALPGVDCYAGRSELAAFLARTRVLVCLLPLTPDTDELLDRVALEALPQGAHVINIARGRIVVDDDLVAMLDSGHIASATLDVFHAEPLPAEHPYWRHPKVTLTPHVSAATLVDDAIAQVAAKIRALERGEAVTGVIDPTLGY